MELFLGFDGGGSKTVCAICSRSGEQLGIGLSGPSNPNTTTAELIQRHLDEAYAQALEQLEVDSDTVLSVRAACLGIAGCASETGKAILYASLLQTSVPFPKEYTSVLSDAEVALQAAHGDQAGLLLIAGTGAICVGRDTDGSWLRAGGWGRIADDLGSGYWIGCEALRIALQQYDDRQPGSPFMTAIWSALGVTDATELVPNQYEPRLASLAPTVVQLSEQGDPTARKILTQAVEHLCALILACSRQAGQAVERYSIIGGVLENTPNLLAHLKTKIGEQVRGLQYTEPGHAAEIAALLLAEQLNPSGDPQFAKALTQTEQGLR
ncbi:N-acetylglucosamine kinase [Coraliomargarita akajimensis]|uniref:ATPase BadF/BadG/BcrA/BcrD type n=1 Tax=Coraliomargarita akajimensis (strain DSM 45221 / IAM 15411 / JCM 23193 / KCTC 12865 / 04OKA010-24) TaxID=583355 RepID=D5EPF8_CORAD|nr:BadF/BadG/BcrA/BcrD ATPase family protein [Coraliomargarita akajimensis]ADE53695.1 ATPase BadF/BadG/BcrA/BcrD type [Coraliomargarita akajimensis DSM 45221]